MEGRKYLFDRITIYILTLLMIAAYFSSSVFAADASDAVTELPDTKFSLTVSGNFTNEHDMIVSIKERNVSICKVANLSIIGNGAFYDAIPELAECGVKFDGMDSSESNDAALKFKETIKRKKLTNLVTTIKANDDGEARFTDLMPGMYLVVVDGSGNNRSEIEVDPFLVSVPGIEKKDGVNIWVPDVYAFPKAVELPSYGIAVDPPVSKKVVGKSNCKDVFYFELSADDISNPMPLGSRDGKKEVSIVGAGEIEFGEWNFTEPGTYKYTVREIKGSNRKYEYDETIFTITFRVYFSEDNLEVEKIVTSNKDKEKLSAAVFVNRYRNGIPDTGDSGVAAWLLSVICTATLLTVLEFKRRASKGQNYEEK